MTKKYPMPKIALTLDSKNNQNHTFTWMEKKLESIKEIEKSIGKFTTHSNQKKHSIELKGEKISVKVKVKKKKDASLVCIDVDLPFKFALLKGVIKTKLETKISSLLKKMK